MCKKKCVNDTLLKKDYLHWNINHKNCLKIRYSYDFWEPEQAAGDTDVMNESRSITDTNSPSPSVLSGCYFVITEIDTGYVDEFISKEVYFSESPWGAVYLGDLSTPEAKMIWKHFVEELSLRKKTLEETNPDIAIFDRGSVDLVDESE